MYLKNLHLKQFRNYQDQKIQFTAPKTIILGNNAQGKSNLLEAVEILATLRSHRLGRDGDFIQTGQDTAQIHALIDRDNSITEATLTMRRNGRRTVAINGQTLRRQMDFLGVLNAVQFSSLDLDLVRGSPENRRHWLDTLLMQLEPIYAHTLQQYNHILRQRNAFLKKIQHSENSPTQINHSSSQKSTLAIWDTQLVATGTKIITRRDRILQRLTPIAAAWHKKISGDTEKLQINYLPNVPITQPHPQEIQTSFLSKIHQRAVAELYQGSTQVGPHRDEIELTINQTPARQYGSQGQQRTLVLALKLAELQLIEQIIQDPPLLLLDDVLAELDPYRQNQLLEAIENRFQTLITTTHLSSFDSQWLQGSQILLIKSGHISTKF